LKKILEGKWCTLYKRGTPLAYLNTFLIFKEKFYAFIKYYYKFVIYYIKENRQQIISGVCFYTLYDGLGGIYQL